MDDRLWSIVSILSDEQYRTSEEIGKELKLSEKTVRTGISRLRDEMVNNGANLISKRGYGYKIEVVDQEKWLSFNSARYEIKTDIPSDSNGRVEYILFTFLNNSNYVKLDEFAEELYVSVKTLTNEIKRVEYILGKFNIKLERKPYYGIRAIGDEFSKRCCSLKNFYFTKRFNWYTQNMPSDGIYDKITADVLLELSREKGLSFTEIAFQNTVIYLSISIYRMNNGNFIQDFSEEMMDGIEENVSLVKELYSRLGIDYLEIPEAEIYYSAIFIAGKRALNGEHSYTNAVISDELNKILTEILEEIFIAYNVDLRGDFNFRKRLIEHLIPLEVRLNYGIPIESVEDLNIKEKYFFAYNMAQIATSKLSKYFDKELPSNEILCITVYLQMALEERINTDKKNNILLVCVSSRVVSKMLKHKLLKEFPDNIGNIETCGIYDLDDVNIDDFDFIFTTVPLYKQVNVPIMQIGSFLENSDIVAVKDFLKAASTNYFDMFYDESLFFTNLKGDSREEIIHNICDKIAQVEQIPEEFEESVLEREFYGSTDFGNYVAIPHPTKIMTKQTFVTVAILENEIIWSTNPVKVVILTSLGEIDDQYTKRFYETSAEFISSKDKVKLLIEKPTFDNFKDLINM